MFIFTKEMAEKLRKIRETARLTQKEVALRIGIKTKSGKSFISQLESGMVKNPTLKTILDYLSACGTSWVEFIKELDRIDFKMRHEEMISLLPPEATKRKIQRDAMRYEIGVEFPSKEKEEIDFARLKKIIKDKVEKLVNKEETTLTPALSPNRVPRPEQGRFDHQGSGSKDDLSLRGAKRRSNLISY
jgi:transcriptional regulator with XRE-family HTH domain